MRNAGVIYRDIALVEFVYFSCNREFSASFYNIDDLAEIMNLWRSIKEVLVHDLPGKEQPGF